MYRKLHLQLTLFCCVVISAILTTMTVFSLKLIQDNQNLRQFDDFQKNTADIYEALSNQDNISHAWLKKKSNENKFHISILDNETPIIFDSRSDESSNNNTFKLAREAAWKTYTLSSASAKNSGYVKHVEFQMESTSAERTLVSVGYIPKTYSILTVTMLSFIPSQLSGLKNIFLPIIFAALAANVLLSCFSFFLIKSLIRPLVKSHEDQIVFFSAASHELRSPITVIMTSLPLLKNMPSKKWDASYSIIEKECLRMKRLVDDMFTLASLDNGAISIHKENTFINNLLIDCYEKFETLANQKQIRIDFRLPDTLIPKVNCDPERISQVFTILLDNAISYTPSGGIIQISVLFNANTVTISVSDSGLGIPDESKKSIFNRFYRCDNSRTDKNHFGLGLSIAKEIIDLHSGTITVVDSNLGGAKFVVMLPLYGKL